MLCHVLFSTTDTQQTAQCVRQIEIRRNYRQSAMASLSIQLELRFSVDGQAVRGEEHPDHAAAVSDPQKRLLIATECDYD